MSLPKLLDPECLNCGHKWSAHFVNDPDPRCSLVVTLGKESWCACGRFRGGCAKCNHPMADHVAPGMEICRAGFGTSGRFRCKCDGYEPSR